MRSRLVLNQKFGATVRKAMLGIRFQSWLSNWQPRCFSTMRLSQAACLSARLFNVAGSMFCAGVIFVFFIVGDDFKPHRCKVGDTCDGDSLSLPDTSVSPRMRPSISRGSGVGVPRFAPQMRMMVAKTLVGRNEIEGGCPAPNSWRVVWTAARAIFGATGTIFRLGFLVIFWVSFGSWPLFC